MPENPLSPIAVKWVAVEAEIGDPLINTFAMSKSLTTRLM